MAKAKRHPLVGAFIKTVDQMSDGEMSARGWHTKPAVLTMVNPLSAKKGKPPETLRIFPSADPEGNDGGTIFGVSKEGSFYVFGGPDDQTLMRGLVILNVRPMSKKELEDQAWDIGSWEKAPTVLVLSDGSFIFASTDPEGNGPGIWVVESGAGEELL
jgi:hypothetical protein